MAGSLPVKTDLPIVSEVTLKDVGKNRLQMLSFSIFFYPWFNPDLISKSNMSNP